MGSCTTSRGQEPGAQRGIALIIVLWAVVLLSAMASSMIATGRGDVTLARNLRSAAIAAAAADGAAYQAAFHLIACREQSACNPWPIDGASIDASREDVAISVCLADEGGKLNPNKVNRAVTAGLLGAVGLSGDQAARLADAIVAWRTPVSAATAIAQAALYQQAGLPYAPDGQPFTSVDDLRFVLGMTPTILARLRPNLSVWNVGDPDLAIAPPNVRAALHGLGFDAGQIGFAIPGATARNVAITATATTRDGAEFTRHAVVRLDQEPAGPPVHVLAWSTAPEQPCR